MMDPTTLERAGLSDNWIWRAHRCTYCRGVYSIERRQGGPAGLVWRRRMALRAGHWCGPYRAAPLSWGGLPEGTPYWDTARRRLHGVRLRGPQPLPGAGSGWRGVLRPAPGW